MIREEFKASIGELREFVTAHVSGGHSKYADKPKEYVNNVLVPYNLSIIEMLTGTEAVATNETHISFRKKNPLPNGEELAMILLEITRWESGDHLYEDMVKWLMENDPMGCLPVVNMRADGKALSQDDFDLDMNKGLKRILHYTDFLHLVCLGVHQREAWNMKRRIMLGAIAVAGASIGYLGYRWWTNRKADATIPEEFNYESGLDSNEMEAPVVVTDEIPEEEEVAEKTSKK